MVNYPLQLTIMHLARVALLLIFFASKNSFGQDSSRFFFLPSLGVQRGFCYLARKPGDKNFGINNSHFAIEYGLALQYRLLNLPIIFEAGFHFGASAIGFRYQLPNVKPSSTRPNYAFGTERFCFSIQQAISRAGGRAPAKNILKKNGVRWHLLSGFFIDKRIVDSIQLNIINGAVVYRNLRTTGFGAQIGLMCQFFNAWKSHLQLSVIYGQGFNNMADLDVSYFNGTKQYSALLRTRGSYISIKAAYPLRIF